MGRAQDRARTIPRVRESNETSHLKHPIRSLAGLFLAWKAFLFLVIVNCPGLGYDTSTNLLTVFSPAPGSKTAAASSPLSVPVASIMKTVRWDSIYFVRVAERGYLFEQEWAWGYGYTRLLSILASALFQSDRATQAPDIAIAGIVLSHLSHFLSVLALYALTKIVLGYETQRQKTLCFVSAALHVLSPAGAFLSAPYGEPVFSLLNMTGFYVYALAILAEQSERRTWRDLSFLVAGVLFALATTIRANGLLSGCLFAYDAVQGAVQFLQHGLSFDLLRRTGFVVLGGSIVALGMLAPQYIAFKEYCNTSPDLARPWCKHRLPSIYSWVQARYWNNGFLKYWTISNLPLFLLAGPVLTILVYSSFVAARGRLGQSAYACWSHVPSRQMLRQSIVLRLAILQGVLAVMAFTSFHVQIINRISSGYPVWYWYLASLVFKSPALPGSRAFDVSVRAIVMYAGIQAVLFGSFLPPA